MKTRCSLKKGIEPQINHVLPSFNEHLMLLPQQVPILWFQQESSILSQQVEVFQDNLQEHQDAKFIISLPSTSASL